VREPRQRARVGKGGVRGRKLRIAVGRQINAAEALVVDCVGKWQCDRSYRIIPVVAGVRRAWHDAAAYLRYVVMVLRRATLYCVVP
jgi:hypothetical protein